MSLEAHVPLKERRGFPRVSGDEPCAGPEQSVAQVFSPRERG